MRCTRCTDSKQEYATNLFVYRHAQTDWNGRKGSTQRIMGCAELPINEDGVKEAEQLATVLNVNAEALEHAVETAADDHKLNLNQHLPLIMSYLTIGTLFPLI